LLPLILNADAAESSLKVVTFPEKGKPASAKPWMNIRDEMTRFLPLDIHHLSHAASMTLFTVHQFDKPTGATNASPTCKMNGLVKISFLLLK
jgi:hypothetical protein